MNMVRVIPNSFLIVRLYHTAGWLDLRPVSLGSSRCADSLLYSLPLISPYLLISVFSIVVEPYSILYSGIVTKIEFSRLWYSLNALPFFLTLSFSLILPKYKSFSL